MTILNKLINSIVQVDIPFLQLKGLMKKKNVTITSIKHLWLGLTGMIMIFILSMPGVAVSQVSPPTVNLGTAGDFVLIGKTKISTTGTTKITGDIGVSPVAATYITGFGLIMDVSNTYSTSSLITGKVYAADYTDPTPTKMTIAIGDMETAYTNAAGRTLPDYSELYLGNLTGKTLTRGLYKWTTAVSISSGGLTISGGVNDIFIFQVAQDLVLTSGAIVTLSGGVQASNIFWQVSGAVLLGTTAEMKGIILCKTQIALNTGASLLGRALAQTAVTMDANAITSPSIINGIGSDLQEIPLGFTLEQNFPNPFNPSTKINYNLPFSSKVTLEVYNVIGMKIGELVNQEQAAGYYTVDFNPASLNKSIASGIYFYKINAVGDIAGNNFSSIKKMILLK
jgi:hypothetical protein